MVRRTNVKIGIIGCGKIAQKHLNAYHKLANVDLVVSDINPSIAQKVGEDYKVESVESPDKLIKRDKIDAIDVCVPTPYHARIIQESLDNGKHVFCEKPLTDSLEEAEKIKSKLSETKKVAMVGYLYRFHPAFKLIKEILEERIIGEPYYANFRVGGRGSSSIWKHRKDKAGGAINEIMVHMLDLIVWYFGGIKSTKNLFTDTILKTREINNQKIQADAEDIVLLKLKAKQGVEVICESDLITPSYMNYIEIQGTNGSVWTSILDYFPTIVYCKEPRGVFNQGNNFFEFNRVDLFEKELRYFIESIKNGEQPILNSIEDSMKVLKIIELIREEVK